MKVYLKVLLIILFFNQNIFSQEKNEIANQDNTVSKKACLNEIFLTLLLKEKIKTIPIKNVKILENKKTFQSWLLLIKSANIGKVIVKEVRVNNTPTTYSTGLKSFILFINVFDFFREGYLEKKVEFLHQIGFHYY